MFRQTWYLSAKWPLQGSAVSSLNCRTIHIGVADNEYNLEAFCSLLSHRLQRNPVQWGPWRSGLLCGVSILPLNRSQQPQQPWFTEHNTVQLRISHIRLINLNRRHMFIARTGVKCWLNINSGLWWSQLLSVVYWNGDRSNESDAEKLEISPKSDVYSYRRVHKRASCSDEALCSGCGALTCNIQTSTLVKPSRPLLNSSNFPEHCQCRFRSVLLSAE